MKKASGTGRQLSLLAFNSDGWHSMKLTCAYYELWLSRLVAAAERSSLTHRCVSEVHITDRRMGKPLGLRCQDGLGQAVDRKCNVCAWLVMYVRKTWIFWKQRRSSRNNRHWHYRHVLACSRHSTLGTRCTAPAFIAAVTELPMLSDKSSNAPRVTIATSGNPQSIFTWTITPCDMISLTFPTR